MSRRVIPAVAERTEIFCDKCGREIKGQPDVELRQLHRAMDGAFAADSTVDLCQSCAHAFGKWLKEGDSR